MKFFVPAEKDSAEAERVYEAIAKFNHAPVEPKRICALNWDHNGQKMTCAVGARIPPYFNTGDGPVLAILDCGNLYKVCTTNRGGLRGEAVLAGKGFGTHATYFEQET